jgi:cysteinyl-tRNA synthetase
VASMKDYGQLSHRKLEEQQAGARVAVEAHKKNPADFVLWKLSSPEEPGWDSPWGRGRPGWHIECSAMSERYLGQTFDIHGGGLDLIFPHHENEIAQSRCTFGTPVMANIWMHNGFLQVEGQKMSKSLGNFYTISEILQTDKFGNHPWHGRCLRLAMLETHYRKPIDWTVSRLAQINEKYEVWLHMTEDLDPMVAVAKPNAAVIDALLDDLNTPMVFAELHRLEQAAETSLKAKAELLQNLIFLGVIWSAEELSQFLNVVQMAQARLELEVDEAQVASLIAARLSARTAKNWAESDRIRDELAAMKIAIKDNKDGTTSWEVKR